MRRTILIGIVLLVLIGFAWQSSTKKLTLNLTVEEADMFYRVIDNSNASHMEVKRCMNILIDQIKPQLIDTAKKD